MLTRQGDKVFFGRRLLKQCASASQAIQYRKDVLAQLRIRTRAAEVDDNPQLLAAAVDATLDSAAELIAGNDVTALPAWAQQVCALVIAADATADELLVAMGVTDPDEDGAD